MVLLDSVAKRGSGHTPSKTHSEYWNGNIKWVSLQDSAKLDRRYISETAATITAVGLANSSAVLHPAGVVVLSRDAGVGKSAITTEPMAVSQHFMAWACGPALNNHFLYYWLQQQKYEFERIAIGNTIKTIGLSYFKSYLIPLPPRTEQDAIAETLSDADALIQALAQLIAKKRAIKQGAMQELLTGKRRLPGFKKRWMRTTLGELLSFKNGLNKAKRYFGYGTPIVNYMDVFRHYQLYACKVEGRVSLDPSERANFDVRRGDILFTRTSETQDEIGIAYAVLDDPSDTVFSGFVLRGRPKTSGLLAEFAGYYLRSVDVRSQIIAKASYTTRALTNGRILSGVRLNLPEPDEQLAISGVLTDMEVEIHALEAKVGKARLFKQGMMQELLTGRIRLV